MLFQCSNLSHMLIEKNDVFGHATDQHIPILIYRTIALIFITKNDMRYLILG